MSLSLFGCSEPSDPPIDTDQGNSSGSDASSGSGTTGTTSIVLPTTGGGSDSTDTSASSGESGQTGFTGTESSTGEEPLSFDGLHACMDTLVSNPALSGAAAAVVHGEDLVFSQGFGLRHPQHGGVVDSSTRFRIGSVTKMLTTVAALSLVDEGALELDTPLGELLPPFGPVVSADWTAALTSRQLLSHQGGWYDYITIDGPRDDAALADTILGELFTQVPYLVQPGVMWNYSNVNFSIAGLVVEDVARTPYREVIAQRVLDPLLMDRSTFDVEAVEADGNYAWGILEPEIYAATDYDNAWARPAGFAWSSIDDLAQLAQFLLHGDSEVLSEPTFDQLITPEVDTKLFLDRVHYGLGLFHMDFLASESGFFEVQSYEHGGSLPGYTTLIYVAPEVDTAIAIVGNGQELDLYGCVTAALSDLPEVELQATIPDTQADQTILDDYAGDYIEPNSIVGNFTLSATETGLVVNFPLLDAVEISYEPIVQLISRDNFIMTINEYPLQMTGIRNDDGALTYIRTRAFVGEQSVGPIPAEVGRSPMNSVRIRETIDQIRRSPSVMQRAARSVAKPQLIDVDRAR